MKIRKITAGTMPEAMNQVKKELGSDAVILYTKNINKKRLFGLINKKVVEVVAAIDPVPADQPLERNETIPFPEREPKEALNQSIAATLMEQEPLEMGDVKLRNAMGLQWKVTKPSFIKNICERLLNEGVGPAHVDSIGEALLRFWYSKSIEPSETEMMEHLKKIISGKLSNDFSGINYENKILILIGPTGVGKTTTAAKLASKVVLDDEKSVAFITTDTYRIAAVDQLKTYAKILNVPVEVSYSMEDFIKAVDQHKDKDLIIVDSAGRNYQQSQFVQELKELIPFGSGTETHLVLSATAKPMDLSFIVNQFHDIPINKFILTKVDETKAVGSLLHLLLEYKIGVSYFTNGQNVPDDLIVGEKEAFVRRLVEGVSHG